MTPLLHRCGCPGAVAFDARLSEQGRAQIVEAEAARDCPGCTWRRRVVASPWEARRARTGKRRRVA